MKKLVDEIVSFFRKQNFVIVTTIDSEGRPHAACKGIVKISRAGEILLIDLYRGVTYRNIKANPAISITAVDEHRFKGYCLKGKAAIMEGSDIKPRLLAEWKGKITSRITHRIIKNIQGEKGHPRHPEALFPRPVSLIVMRVEEIIDLTPKGMTK